MKQLLDFPLIPAVSLFDWLGRGLCGCGKGGDAAAAAASSFATSASCSSAAASSSCSSSSVAFYFPNDVQVTNQLMCSFCVFRLLQLSPLHIYYKQTVKAFSVYCDVSYCILCPVKVTGNVCNQMYATVLNIAVKNKQHGILSKPKSLFKINKNIVDKSHY